MLDESSIINLLACIPIVRTGRTVRPTYQTCVFAHVASTDATKLFSLVKGQRKKYDGHDAGSNHTAGHCIAYRAATEWICESPPGRGNPPPHRKKRSTGQKPVSDWMYRLCFMPCAIIFFRCISGMTRVIHLIYHSSCEVKPEIV